MKNEFLKNFVELDITKLVKANWNYKEDNDELKEKLKANIKRNGQIENLIVRLLDTGFYEIVNGNHRYDALVELNIKRVVCYNLGKITLAQAQRIAIETNETRFVSNPEKLSKILSELKVEFPDDDLLSTMPYNSEEFNELLNLSFEGLEDVASSPDLDDDEFDAVPPEKPKSQFGDLYELNGHRLLCGDSTSLQDVTRLMNGKKAHLIYTDPPYNVNYAEFNLNRTVEGGKNWTDEYCSDWQDSMSDEDYVSFIRKFIKLAKDFSIEYVHFYIWHATAYFVEFVQVLRELEIPFDKVPIMWVKQNAPLSWARYKRQYEPCIFGGKGAVNGSGKENRWFGPNNETNVWNINRDAGQNYVHPTQKPVALAARAFNNSSQVNDLVLDLFLGSGTTLITAEQMNRICYGMELEPKFVDVIVKRFIKFCEDNNKPCSVKRNGESITKTFFES